MSLTPKQKEILEFIAKYSEKNGYAPTQTEIAKHFGFRSLGTVQNYLVRLEREGHLQKTWNGKRSLSLSKQKESALGFKSSLSLPLLGQVAAGRPIEVVERQDLIEVPSIMVKKGNHFVLEVSGDSMIEEGILSGDFVVVKQQRAAENGQMVVALVDQAATMKRFYRKASVIELHPANPKYRPMIVTSEQSFQIEGIVTGVIRKVV